MEPNERFSGRAAIELNANKKLNKVLFWLNSAKLVLFWLKDEIKGQELYGRILSLAAPDILIAVSVTTTKLPTNSDS